MADSAPQAGDPGERLLALIGQFAAEVHPRHVTPVTLTSSFERELGFDSLARVELLQRVSAAFHIELPASALSATDNAAQLLRLLDQAGGAGAPPATVIDLHQGSAAGLPDQAATLLDVLAWHVAHQPERTHIVLHDDRHDEHRLRYRDLLEAAREIATGLVERGLLPRQSVALMLPTGADYLASFFGVMLAGGIPVPIYPPARQAQLEDHLARHARILANAQATFIVTVAPAKALARILQASVPGLRAILLPAELRRPATPLPFRAAASDIAFLQYTSGSTGDPKGVMLTHANLLANIRALGQACGVTAGDVFVSWLPLYHDMGLIGAWFGSLYHGIPLVLMSPQAFLARPALWLQLISRHRGTISAAPNFAYALCLRHVGADTMRGLDLSSWRLALNGAEPVSVDTVTGFTRQFGACGLSPQAMTPVYGLAESSVGLAFPPLMRGPRLEVVARAGFVEAGRCLPAGPGQDDTLTLVSCGLPLPGHQLRIADELGRELPDRQVGRVEFRGPSATAGYYRNPQATARLCHGGWLDTGDFGCTMEGELFITGRSKDLIKRGGRNIYPYDLEQAIGEVPGIRRGCVAVFASADPASGSERLIIMAETGSQDPAARAALRTQLQQLALDVIGVPPDEIILASPHAVLKTSSGKIRRLACRQWYEAGQGAAFHAHPMARLRLAAARARVTLALRVAGAWAFGAYAWAVLAALATPAGLLIALLQRPALGRRIAHLAARCLLRLTATSIAVDGLERLPRQPHVLLVNHASYLDTFVLTALLPDRPGYVFAAKQELRRHALVRAVLTGLGAIFVERADVRRSADDVAAMAAVLARGDNLLVFPEGTFERAAGLRAFHLGGFMAAARAASPLVVAGLRGTRAALRDGSWLPRRAELALTVGAVFQPAGTAWRDAARISAPVRAAMLALCGEYDAQGHP
ncbi:AMP-binding protein [Duganella sp. FT3S]|uniref:AMP-binding protein n=1 Tax=Rugamonas fusca TaxID=2758568 RepID=A0A7W2EE20_9BURK|nr:AMP-binding protein [Rugamonas fusca]MBA5604136.1 AMP-binding protein [Rugamonas fusca]